MHAIWKHLEGQHDQSDHGKWAVGAAGREEALRGAGVIDLNAIVEFQRISAMSAAEYATTFMPDDARRVRAEALADDDHGELEGLSDDDVMVVAARRMGRDIDDDRTERLEGLEEVIRGGVEDLFVMEVELPDGRVWSTELTEVTIFDSGAPRVAVEGTFYVDGVEAGSFERGINAQGAYGLPEANRHFLEIESEYAGLGIASEFNRHEEASYVASGVARVNIHAVDGSMGDYNKAGGTYVWASQGFDWGMGGMHPNVIRAVERYMANPEYAALPQAIRDTVDSVNSRLPRLGIDKTGDIPTPREISQLGRLPGDSWWPGKSIMAHSGATLEEARTGLHEGPDWWGVKDLRAGIRVSEGEVRSQQVRAEMARERERAVEQHVAAWRAKSPLVGSDPEFIMVNGQPVPIDPKDARVRELVGV